MRPGIVVGIVGGNPLVVKGLKSGSPGTFCSELVVSASIVVVLMRPGSSSVKFSSSLASSKSPSVESRPKGGRVLTGRRPMASRM